MTQRVSRRAALATIGAGGGVFLAAVLMVRSGVTAVDGRWFLALNDPPPSVTHPLDLAARAFTPIGLALAAVVALTFAVVRARSAWPLVWAAVAAILGWLSADLAKLVVARPRPSAALVEAVLRQAPARGTSFPSSHTAIAVAVVLALVPFLPTWVVPIGIAYAAAVAWSRIFLGVHYLLDVLAGAALGTVAGGCVWLAMRVWRRTGPAPPPSD
jgi:membrane-associated phospholipid phosphatase